MPAFAALELHFHHRVAALEEGELARTGLTAQGRDFAQTHHTLLIAEDGQRGKSLCAATLFKATNLACAIGFAGNAGGHVACELADALADLLQ